MYTTEDCILLFDASDGSAYSHAIYERQNQDKEHSPLHFAYNSINLRCSTIWFNLMLCYTTCEMLNNDRQPSKTNNTANALAKQSTMTCTSFHRWSEFSRG